MMVTRWGDSDPTGKAFMCSVLLHLSLAFGAVAVSPPEQLVLASIPERLQIRKILLEGEEPMQAKTSGNTPVWEKLLNKPTQQISRTDQAPMEFEPLESPERRPEPITRPDITIPDVNSRPELEVSRPEPRDFGDVGRKIESAAPRTITDSTAEARPDINMPSLSPIRRTVQESGLKDVSVERTPNRGSVDRIAPDFDATRQLAKLDTTVDPTAFLERGTTDQAIQRRTAPVPSSLQEKTTGTVSEESTAGAASGGAATPKFSRLRTRTPKMEDFGGSERFRPDLTPQSESPLRHLRSTSRRSQRAIPQFRWLPESWRVSHLVRERNMADFRAMAGRQYVHHVLIGIRARPAHDDRLVRVILTSLAQSLLQPVDRQLLVTDRNFSVRRHVDDDLVGTAGQWRSVADRRNLYVELPFLLSELSSDHEKDDQQKNDIDHRSQVKSRLVRCVSDFKRHGFQRPARRKARQRGYTSIVAGH